MLPACTCHTRRHHMKNKLTEQEIDALFDHMAELMSRLPEIQKTNEKFRKAAAARDVLTCAGQVEAAQRALDGARANVSNAMETGNTSGQYFFGNSESYAVGVLTDHRHRLEAALQKYGYADVQAAQTDALPEDALAELQDALMRFRSDYETTLAQCQEYQEKV